MTPTRSLMLVVAGVLVVAPGIATAQPELPRCDTSAPAGYSARAPLPMGFVIEVTRNPDEADIQARCRAVIRDGRGREVWRAEGFGTALDAWTGHDVTGDGRPDAVVAQDTGGGNRCCWSYHILTLAPSFSVAASLDFVPVFDTDASGRTLIFQVVPFYDLGPSMAQAPTVVLVHRLDGARLTNLTAAQCPALLHPPKESPMRLAPAEPTAEARAAARTTAGPIPFAVEQTRVDVMTYALQQMACGDETGAGAMIRSAWPAEEAGVVLNRVLGAWQGRTRR
jgi:hypothetical protein